MRSWSAAAIRMRFFTGMISFSPWPRQAVAAAMRPLHRGTWIRVLIYGIAGAIARTKVTGPPIIENLVHGQSSAFPKHDDSDVSHGPAVREPIHRGKDSSSGPSGELYARLRSSKKALLSGRKSIHL